MSMSKTSTSTEQKIWGAVSYLWILSLVALAAKKDDNYVRFHANQGLLLFVLSIILTFIPLIGWLLNVLVMLAALIGLVKAFQGEKWEIPGLSGAAKTFGDWLIKIVKL